MIKKLGSGSLEPSRQLVSLIPQEKKAEDYIIILAANAARNLGHVHFGLHGVSAGNTVPPRC